MRIAKRSLVIALVIISSTFHFALVILPENARATTLFVGGPGPGNYTKIQLAIDASGPGGTIFVFSGTYNEDVSVYKTLTLTGEDRNTTIIQGSGAGDVLLVMADWSNVTGFTTVNSGSTKGDAGIKIFFAQNCLVSDNIATNNREGISVWQSDGNRVSYNFIENNQDGVYLWYSGNNRIENNTISKGTLGIFLDPPFTSHNVLADNVIFGNTLDGIRAENTDNITIVNNIITNNRHAISLTSSVDNTLTNNTMIENGVLLSGPSIEHWNSQVIESSNTVNGNPLYYWKDRIGGTIPSGAGQVILANCDGVLVENQNLSNGSVGIEAGFSSDTVMASIVAISNSYVGVYHFKSDNGTIEGNTVSRNRNEGIYLGGSADTDVVNNNVSSNGGSGIALYFTNGSIVTDNDVRDNVENGISLEYSYGNTVSNNTAQLSTYGIYLDHSDVNLITDNTPQGNTEGLYILNSNANTIEGNTATDNVQGLTLSSSMGNRVGNNSESGNDVGFYLSGSDGNILFDNILSSSGEEGITLWFSSQNVLKGNVMPETGIRIGGSLIEHWNTHTIELSNTVNGKPVRYWKNATGGTVPLGAGQVILANCSDVVVEGQDVSGGTFGMLIGFSSNNYVGNNTAFSNTFAGIALHGSTNHTISNNTASDNKLGIALALSSGNTLSDNTVASNNRSNWDAGMSISYSDRNTLSNNTALSNPRGILIDNSDDNTITENDLLSNGEGINIWSSDNNRVYHNNFIDNSLQAIDNRNTNQWDNGYPLGGNWWSDYAGVDLMTGPGQDVPGSDGLGDTPYIIDANSEDRYPLMTPPNPFPPSAPLNLLASPGDQEITLTWDPPSFDGGLPITNYRIYQGFAPGGEVFYAQIGNVLTFLDSSLTNGQMYCYKVSALNGVGEGPMSNEACATPTTTPGAPVILQADLSGNGMENVTVKWNLSLDDGNGQDSVVGYLIYRGTTYDVNAVGYQPIASVPSGTTEYNDNYTGEGDPDNYFYQVCAIDLNNLTNCSANQAGKFTRSLLNGPNLISIPLIQSDENIETVLQTVKWDKAWTYDSSAQKWKSHTLFKPYKGELEDMNTSMGIWVNVIQTSNLTVAGIVPSSTSIYLYAGWNLVGFPSFNGTYTVSDLKAAVGVETIEGFEALTPPYFLRALTDGDVLQAGYGYWIKMSGDGLWTVVNS